MKSCLCEPLKRSQVENNYRSSYNRSYEYKNVVDNPLSHIRVKQDARKDLRTPVMRGKNLSTYNETFGSKSQDFKNDSDYYPRSSVNSRPNLQRLHEENMKNPPKPHESGLTTTGMTYQRLKPISTPQTLPRYSLAEKYTCPIQILGKDEFPSIPLNETSSYKLSDNYVSTTHLTHVDFSEKQRNGIAKKDVITFADAAGIPKIRGSRIEKNFGPYFQRDAKTLYRQLPKQFCQVPYSGSISTYKKEYKHPATNLSQFEYDFKFPVLYKLTKGDILTVPGMYCTEQSHLGTGWPLKAVIDTGRVQSTF